MKKKFIPRTVGSYGMTAHPLIVGDTCMESDEFCTDYGKFERKGEVRHKVSRELIRVRADLSDTWFSIPATTTTEHGYVTAQEEVDSRQELVFIPHTNQLDETPAQYRARWRKDSK
jgi:hypothetical protein